MKVPHVLAKLSNFLSITSEGFEYCPVSIIVEKGILFTYRSNDLKTFSESVKKLKASPASFVNGYQVLMTLLETSIDLDADLIEALARKIAKLNQDIILRQKRSDEEVLIQISSFQNETMSLRENIIDKQRLISALMKSNSFPEEHMAFLRIMIQLYSRAQ